MSPNKDLQRSPYKDMIPAFRALYDRGCSPKDIWGTMCAAIQCVAREELPREVHRRYGGCCPHYPSAATISNILAAIYGNTYRYWPKGRAKPHGNYIHVKEQFCASAHRGGLVSWIGSDRPQDAVSVDEWV